MIANMRGITLLELIVVSSLVLLLANMASAEFSRTMDRIRALNTINQLNSELRYARTLAVAHRQTMSVCGTDDGFTCEKIWRNYLLIFHDANRDRVYQAGDETLYHKQEYLRQAPIILRVSAGSSRIRFKHNGLAIEYGSINDCAALKYPKQAKTLVMMRTGRTRIDPANYHKGRSIGCPPHSG